MAPTPVAPVSGALLAAVTMAVTDAVVAADDRGNVLLWTGAAASMFGWSEDEVVGRPLHVIMPERYRAAHAAGFARVAAGGPSDLVGRTTVELEGLRRDGTEFPIELSLGRGEHLGAPVFVGVVRDITERRAEQERLRVSQERFRSAFEHAPIGMTMTTTAGHYLEANPAFCAIVGYSPGELASRTFSELTHPDDREHDDGVQARLLAGERDHERVLKRYVRKDGRIASVQVDVSAVRDGQGRAAHFLSQVQDVTDLEHFASTASHDLNEPLRIVDGYLALLERRAAARLTDEEKAFFGEAREATGQMRELIDALLAYARTGTAEARREELDAGVVAREALRALDAAVRERRAQVEVGPLPRVRADATLLRQVLQNLLANAVKFADAAGPRIALTAEPSEGGWTFSVRDNGPGIPVADREKVFGMFTRTATAVGTSGSGIGLAAAERAVRRHQGRIWVADSPGGGADVRFFLPS